MAVKSGTDAFANYAIITCIESAANTLTYKKLETGISISEKVAWIINRVEYVINDETPTQFNASGDSIIFGLSVSNSPTVLRLAEETIIDYNEQARYDFGTAASGFFKQQPHIKDFSMLPGGGLLVPPVPLFLFCKGSSNTAANTIVARLHYTLLTLSIDQYWELVEARRVISS